ncbi:Hydroxymethylglutaryl-CoA synthase [Lentilactobacillus hilgardii]|uniref:hydroxymethylglutaryl-CoA synthase n=1 Tax=Lentilactobacillus hilgardii TaxID=1588 RepID=UPI00019C601D|nr:hydroxymethylglutaryl-CoA synthase [Lentilactobacillus hilgardii]EEI18854.1 hydroxymethylglutaryl-CoA synthase [Lentilactobacillus buchneri ATCC 11577]MCT3395508.1 hydroxymethylglutaryl-CoA synthase [Lentilactobacillus hilgardii]QIR09267.1 Hydroxymethylglutaryl-CoA synthase [Lentilactobacillus hilgardii]
MTVGIDKIGFYTSPYFIDMVDLAHARNEDPKKYLIGIGQKKQAVIPPTQDVVTMAANAAQKILSEGDKEKIDLVIFGTETGVDNSKSAAIYVQSLLGISKQARSFEIKQACYGGTAGVQMAVDHIRLHPESKALVLAADIARYGLNTPGEVTQGGGAVAMVISSNPRILEVEDKRSFHSDNIMDFWRPLYRHDAVVDGHYSNSIYADFFQQTWMDYRQKYHRTIDDFRALTFHLPYTKMGLKALRSIIDQSKHPEAILEQFEASRMYNALVGNLYTGSLYLSLISLLSNSEALNQDDLIGLFSYGSGAQGEFYSGRLSDQFDRSQLKTNMDTILSERSRITIEQYQEMYQTFLPLNEEDELFDVSSDNSCFVLKGRKENRRIYLTKNGSGDAQSLD